MNPARFFFLIISVLIASWGCDKSVSPARNANSITQMPGCLSTLRASATPDSCFSYQFHDVLVVDFCATANCCPDINRFSTEYLIRNDTIAVTIADTAAHLCRCTCTYNLHAEYSELTGNQYLFVVYRQDYSSRLVFYSERVYRN